MIFLGTGAAECFPNPFCSCPACTKALLSTDRKLKRRRSSLLLNQKNLIDFGPDVMHACGEYSCSLAKLENVFITHSHEDHLDIWNIGFMQMAITKTNPISLYMSKAAYKGLETVLSILEELPDSRLKEKIRTERQYYNFIPLELYTEYKIDDMRVIAAKSNHRSFFSDEYSLNYLFDTPRGKLFYACDTGRFFSETVELLKGQALDILVIEGTFGATPLSVSATHLNTETLCEMIDKLKRNGGITCNTRIYVTHISHKGVFTHYDYEEHLQKRYGKQISVAYDGMNVAF
jgi:phosphoribosyl 1,2-cyclic phosphodiesterase